MGGKDCTKSCFAYAPDDDHANWKLPIECPDHDADWEKTHIRNAISRWSSTDMPNAAEKSQARGRIKAAAKKYDIEVDDDSLKDEAQPAPDEGDACAARDAVHELPKELDTPSARLREALRRASRQTSR